MDSHNQGGCAMKSGHAPGCALAMILLTALGVQPAAAQNYPIKPVTFVTPAAAGNSPDVITRTRRCPADQAVETAGRGDQSSRRRRSDRSGGRGGPAQRRLLALPDAGLEL